jgi:hypothetical protein
MQLVINTYYNPNILIRMHKGVAAYIAVLLIIIILWYFFAGFKLPGHTSTTITSNGISNTPTTSASTTVTVYSSPCSNTGIFNTTAFNTTLATTCRWTGGALGLWVASGDAQYESVLITGTNKTEYINQTSQYKCPTLYKNFTAKANDTLTIRLYIGPKAANATASGCTTALAKLNTTTVLPQSSVYNNVYNGNFSSDSFTGWTLASQGFGTAPMNIIWANLPNVSCYIGAPWSNANFTFFASTFHCGTAVAPGNLTSSLFMVTEPYLDFRIISPANADLYVEIINQSYVPEIVAHYGTFNSSSNPEAFSTFRNASIPLSTVYGKPVRIKVVAVPFGNKLRHLYIALGGFGLSSTIHQDRGVLVNESFNSTG